MGWIWGVTDQPWEGRGREFDRRCGAEVVCWLGARGGKRGDGDGEVSPVFRWES
jgi:hypothetical protein